jgi:hypothetical protein
MVKRCSESGEPDRSAPPFPSRPRHLPGPRTLCARHGVDAGGASPLRALVMGMASRRQLRRREAGWRGSRTPSSEPTNRNRIQGRHGGVTRQWTGRRLTLIWNHSAKVNAPRRERRGARSRREWNLAARPERTEAAAHDLRSQRIAVAAYKNCRRAPQGSQSIRR